MANQGAWTNTPTGSGKITIPAGYHNGSGYVDTATVYTNGYNAGVTDADARANTNSANYQAGYNAGISASRPFSVDLCCQSNLGGSLNGGQSGSSSNLEYTFNVANYSWVTVKSLTKDYVYTFKITVDGISIEVIEGEKIPLTNISVCTVSFIPSTTVSKTSHECSCSLLFE